jgi:hypothetical protein
VIRPPAERAGLAIAIVAYPCISNLDEFAPLTPACRRVASLGRRGQSIAGADLLILPGSKNVAGDLAWLRQRARSRRSRRTRADKPTLAICGGLQMLGSRSCAIPIMSRKRQKGWDYCPTPRCSSVASAIVAGLIRSARSADFGRLSPAWTSRPMRFAMARRAPWRSKAPRPRLAPRSRKAAAGNTDKRSRSTCTGCSRARPSCARCSGSAPRLSTIPSMALADFIDGHFAHDALMGLIERG